MPKTQKILTISLWGLMVMALIAMVVSGALRRRHMENANADDPSPTNRISDPMWPVPAFSLTDQNGKPLELSHLNGHVWVADFIFTSCNGPCPMMTTKMAQIQKTIGAAPVKLISFSVDPETDTPAVLKRYLQKFKADESNWLMATGNRAEIGKVAAGMKIATSAGAGPMAHGTYFILVDKDGRVRGYYGGQDEEGWKRVAEDAVKLATGT